MNAIVILLDGFPYKEAKQFSVFDDLGLQLIKVRPQFGFSINIKPAIYAGLSPDELGILNMWQPDYQKIQNNQNNRAPDTIFRQIRRILDLSIRWWQPLSRSFHKLFDLFSSYSNTANIPFELLPFFTENHLDHSQAMGILSELGFSEITVKPTRDKLGTRQADRDKIDAFYRGLSRSKLIYLPLIELDYIGHFYGFSSKKFIEHLGFLIAQVKIIVNQFRYKYGEDSKVVVLSDHGFTDITDNVFFNIEDYFGPPRPDRYLYFLDSTMARIWVYKDSLRRSIKQFCSEFHGGELLSDTDRNRYGITNQQFGDYFIILNEGMFFYPGYYGGFVAKGMHGYRPELDSQQAFFAVYNPEENKSVYEISESKDIARYLRAYFGN